MRSASRAPGARAGQASLRVETWSEGDRGEASWGRARRGGERALGFDLPGRLDKTLDSAQHDTVSTMASSRRARRYRGAPVRPLARERGGSRPRAWRTRSLGFRSHDSSWYTKRLQGMHLGTRMREDGERAQRRPDDSAPGADQITVPSDEQWTRRRPRTRTSAPAGSGEDLRHQTRAELPDTCANPDPRNRPFGARAHG